MIAFERWDEIKPLVQGALDLPDGERGAYLDEACQGDQDLRRSAEALLAVSATRADAFDDFVVKPSSVHSVTFKEGDNIGPYRIVRTLGKGGMGAVYLAEDTRHDRQVALKVLPASSRQVPMHEQRALAKLHHPNIATFYDSGQTKDGFAYFVMEFVEGESITTYSDARGLTLGERLKIFLAVCDAVSYAHRNLVVHRDIKPANILVTREGRPKLLDFGIAKVLSPELATQITQPEDRSLTIAFASPEQLSGEITSTSTDIYSLGVLLCLLLTGRLPYPVKSYHDLSWAVRNMEPERPSQLVLKKAASTEDDSDPLPLSASTPSGSHKLARLLKGDLDAIILRALRKKPDRRYQTVAELAADIDRSLNNEPVSARRGSTRYRAAKFIRRHTIAVAAASVATVAVLGFTLWLSLLYQEAAHQRTEAQKAARRAEGVTDFLVQLFNVSDPWDQSPKPATVSEVLDRAYRRSAVDLGKEPAIRMRIQGTLGQIFTNLGDFERGEQMLALALKEPSARLDPARAEAWYYLGVLRYQQGKYPAAIAAHHAALQIQRQLLPPPHASLGGTLTGLAQAHEENGDLNAARLSYTEALREEALAPKPKGDFSRANTLTGFAGLERKASNYPAAEKRAHEALAVLHRLYPIHHPRIGLAFNNLGVILAAEERFPEAREAYGSALGAFIPLLGANHPETLKAKSNIAEMLRQTGRLIEAKQLQVEVLSIRRKVLPPDHPSLAISLNNLASILLETGPLSEAEAHLNEALAIDRRNLGDEHPYVARSYSNLGVVRTLQDRYDEADHYFTDALLLIERTRGKEDRSYATYQGNRAQALVKVGRLREAEEAVNEAITISQKILGKNHVRIAILRGTIARIRLKQGRLKEAEQIVRAVEVKTKQDLGPESPSMVKAQTLLAEILIESGRYAEAEPLLLKAISYWKERAGPSGLPTIENEKLLDRLH